MGRRALFFLIALPVLAISQQCPLDFSVVNGEFALAKNIQNATEICSAVREELNLVIAAQLQRSQTFLFQDAIASACVQELTKRLQRQGVTVDLKAQCSLDTQTLQTGSRSCPNITTVSDFRTAVGNSSLSSIHSSCSSSLQNVAACSACTAAVVSSVTYRRGPANWSCLDYSHIYAAALVTPDGPTNRNTVICLFYQLASDRTKNRAWIYALGGVAAFILLASLVASLLYLRWRKGKTTDNLEHNKTLETSMHENESLKKFTMNDMKAATNNFHRTTIIGQGGFGNVYKGVLSDGKVVALKRFKNCSPTGDEAFVHEVEMISSVRHKNLAPIIGWCIGSTSSDGHQRIIVYEYMPNGSLDDHLFGKSKKNLDWPTREKIVIGIARGLSYLHKGAQPAIIHRDIKGSNVLLDRDFNAKVADFGLARFAPEGISHMTTGVAGTQGYVAPEYVLYQQLTDRSDVYSFGIVLLELLSGRKALCGQSQPIADWAWSVVKKTDGKILDILQSPPMENIGSEQVMERFVLVGLLCAHPQVAYRPSMAEVVKMLESDTELPPLPEQPVSLMINPMDFQTPTNTSGSSTAPYYFSSLENPR